MRVLGRPLRAGGKAAFQPLAVVAGGRRQADFSAENGAHGCALMYAQLAQQDTVEILLGLKYYLATLGGS